MSDGTARAEDVEVGKTAAAGDECRVADGPPANVRLPQGTADVPPASSRGVSPRVGPGGETPPELAGADACGTPAAARPLRPTNARWPHAGPFSWRSGSPHVGGYRIAVVAALGLGWLWFGGQVVGSACREFHLDEGWELTKAWMLQRGFSLYGEFWNDQPPLHTWVLSGLLAVPGAGTGLARGVSLGMATLLMGCVAWLVARMAGFWGGVVAVVLVAGSAQVLLQCGAVMIGLPAYALGLASVVCAWRWRETGRGSLAVLSGVMAGLALQTKLTAGLVIGALVVQVLVWGWQAGAGEPRRAWARAVAGWTAGAVGAWGLGEGTGTALTDKSGNAVAGTLNLGTLGNTVNADAWQVGKLGKALKFDGVDDYVSMGDVLDQTGAFTLSAWIQPNGFATSPAIISKSSGGAEYAYYFQVSGTNGTGLRFNVSGQSGGSIGGGNTRSTSSTKKSSDSCSDRYPRYLGCK